MSAIAKVTLLIGALAVGHDLDHILNQPARDYAVEVTVPGLLSFLAIGGTLFLALRRDPLAPLAAVLLGFAIAVGFTAVHLLPHWSAFSDPYGEVSLNALSWFFVIAPIAAGLLLASLGLRELASRPRARHA